MKVRRLPKAQRNSAAAELTAAARAVLLEEAEALKEVASRLDDSLAEAAQRIARCNGRLVVSGMGKTGFVAQKTSATFASTGTPSLFLHPADALHGDLGRITAEDVVLALSASGETEEMVRLIGPLKRVGAQVVVVTADRRSTLGASADLVIETGFFEEAGHGLAPTTSTTVMLGIGDALAMVVQKLRGFTTDQFHQNHPGGTLGRRLMRVHEVMRKGEMVPVVQRSTKLADVIAVMTKTAGRPGAAIVVDRNRKLVGMFTDGDLRRLIETGGFDLEVAVSRVMTRGPKTVVAEQQLSDAAALLREYHVDQVPVIDAEGRPVGLLDVQDLLTMRLL